MEEDIEKVIARIEEINREILTYDETNDAESIKRTKLYVEKFNLQRKLNEHLQKTATEERQARNRKAAEIRDMILQINDELETYDEHNDAESIKRTELGIKKYNLQKELKQLIADGAELYWGNDSERDGEEQAPKGEEKPAEEEPAPKGEEKPAEEEPAPKGKEKPAEEEPAPKGEEKPAEEEPAPKGEEKPAEEEPAPKGEEGPAEGEQAPKEKQTHEEEKTGVAKLGFFKRLALSVVLVIKKLCKKDGKMAEILTGWENKIKDSAIPLPVGDEGKQVDEAEKEAESESSRKPEKKEESSLTPEEQERIEAEQRREQERKAIADFERPRSEQEEGLSLPIWRIMDNEWLSEKLNEAGENDWITQRKAAIERQAAERKLSEEKAAKMIEIRNIPRIDGKTDAESVIINTLRISILKAAHRRGIDLINPEDGQRRSLESIYSDLEIEIAKERTEEVSRQAAEGKAKGKQEEVQEEKDGEDRE